MTFPDPSHQMPKSHHTVQEVITFVKRQFGDESGVQLEDADIIRWINQAQIEIVGKNHIIQASAMAPIVDGQAYYNMPDNVLRVESVWYNNAILQAKAFENVGDVLGDNMKQEGEPELWYKWAGQIYIWPIPSTGQINIFYSALPKTVTALTDLLSLPDRYYDRICEYAMSKAYELDEDWQAHAVNKQAFEDKLLEANNAENNQQGAFLVATDAWYE